MEIEREGERGERGEREREREGESSYSCLNALITLCSAALEMKAFLNAHLRKLPKRLDRRGSFCSVNQEVSSSSLRHRR